MKNYSKDWKNAKKYILGGNMLLSKRPEMFLPKYWPTYFKRASKISVWDLYNNKFKDFIFAVGQSPLGYRNSFIDKEIIKNINFGNMTTLNCKEEVLLSKKLLMIHKWAGKVKFARSGGEANALAIRIARSACVPLRDNIAVCGYHGWHDWYLSVNLSSRSNLDEHLLPGLDPLGVPKELKNKTHAFEYGNFKQLKKIHHKHKLGIVKMEVARDKFPDVKFLKNVRKFCIKEKIILIFDECTSGFRYNLGGLHLKIGVKPDLAMFGKALGNGYAITAVIGRNKIMNKAINSFISSTFWTERIGFVAALKSIEFYEKNKIDKVLKKNGKYILLQWKKLSKKYKLNLKINDMYCICKFEFEENNNLLKTLITQEMLKMNYLASNMIYVSIYHDKNEVDKYINKLDFVFKLISKIRFDKKKILENLITHQAKKTFKRLII